MAEIKDKSVTLEGLKALHTHISENFTKLESDLANISNKTLSAEGSAIGQVPTSNGDGTWNWKEQQGGDNTKAAKRAFGKVWFDYSSYNSGCSTIEEDAQVLAKYSLVVGGGSLHSMQESADRTREYAVVTRAKEINPDIKFFWYIGVASYRGGDILSENGVWDENSQDVPIMENQEILREIHRALNVGGNYTGLNSETGLYDVTGGIKFDGIFWDEFDMDSDEGCYNQGFNSFTGERYWSDNESKDKFLIEYARNLGLLNFTNGWSSHGIKYMTENDYFCLESNETRHNQNEELQDIAYWMNEQTSARLYNYYSSDDYTKYKCKAVALSYIPIGHTQEEKERILTWCVFNTLVQGGHYVSILGADNDWAMPELVDLFRIDDGKEYNLKKIKNGVYSIYANGHSLTTYRTMAGTTLGGGRPANMSTLNKIYIEIDGVIFQNAYAHLPEYIYNSEKEMNTLSAKVQETNRSLQSKTYAPAYQKFMIDDWKQQITFADYTNWFGGTINYEIICNNLFTDYEYEYIDAEDRINYKYISTSPHYGSGIKWVASKLKPGHTYEIGCIEVTGANLSAIQTQCEVDGELLYNNWSYNGTYQRSNLDPSKQCIYRYTVGDESPTEICLLFTSVDKQGGNADGLYTISVKGIYCVDVNEFDEDLSKTWYTNMTDTTTGYSIINDATQYIDVTTNTINNSVSVEFKSHEFISTGIEYQIIGGKPNHTYEIGFEELTGNVMNQIQILIELNNKELVNNYHYNENSYEPSELDPNRKSIVRITLPDTYSNESFRIRFMTVSKQGGDGTTLYNIYLKNLYCYDLAETDELVIRGKTPSKTTLAVCRVTDQMLAMDNNFVRNAIYISDSGRAFITNVNGIKTDIVGGIYLGAVEAGYVGTPEEFGAKIFSLINKSSETI